MNREQLLKRKQELERQVDTLDIKQMSQKILLNSLYGALGNPYFRFYDIRCAEAITLTGQVIIQWIAKRVNEHLNRILKTEKKNYVLGSDTDSIYVSFEDLVNKLFSVEQDRDTVLDFLDKASNTRIQRVITDACKEIAQYFNCPTDEILIMKRETISETGIFLRKKHYILSILDDEGIRLTKPKIKMVGIEAVKSSTPAVCKDGIREAIEIILEKDEKALVAFLEQKEKDFKNLSPEEIAFPRGVNGMEKYRDATTIYRKGTPIHVRGSLLFNHHIEKNGLDGKYELVQSGDKIKFLYLKVPNPVGENVLAFPTLFPAEICPTEYIDYNKQFEKAFLKSVKSITDVIGWKTEDISDLGAFFS